MVEEEEVGAVAGLRVHLGPQHQGQQEALDLEQEVAYHGRRQQQQDTFMDSHVIKLEDTTADIQTENLKYV